MKRNDLYKFLYKGLIFFCVFLVVDICMGFIFQQLRHKALENSPGDLGMVTDYAIEKVNSEIVIMGASEAKHSLVCSMIRDSLDMSTYNCAKDGKRFYYQNAVLNSILDRYSPKLILWSVSPNFLSKPLKEDMDGISDLNPWYKENKYCRNAILAKSKYEHIKMLSYLYRFNSKLIFYLYKIFIPDKDSEYGAYIPIYGTLSDNTISSRTLTDNLDNRSVQTLNETLARCKDLSIDVVFIFTTRYENVLYQDNICTQKLKEIINDYQFELIEKFYNNEDFLNPHLFKDRAHFNHNGAIIFTDSLITELKKLKI